MSKLDLRTKNQILKNLEDDKKNSMYFEKTLKYIEKKEIHYEEVFGLIMQETETLKGLPLYLIFSNKISNPSYIYDGISLPIYFDMYNKFQKENILVKNGGKYILENTNSTYLTKILNKIKDFETIKTILKLNKDFIFNSIEIILPNHSYSTKFSNYLSMLLYTLNTAKNTTLSYHNDVIVYTKEDIENIEKIIDLVLFDLDLSNKEIEELLYYEDSNKNNGHSAFSYIICNQEVELFKKIVNIYGFDYEKTVPDNYPYYYMPDIPVILSHSFDYNNKEQTYERLKKMLGVFISLKCDIIPKELLSQTKSADVAMSKMFGKDNCENTISRGYKKSIKSIKEVIDKNENKYYQFNTNLVKYYIENTNTLIKDNDFWNQASVSNDEIYQIVLEKNKEIKRIWNEESIKEVMKNAIYLNKPELIKEIFESDKNNIKYLHIQNQSNNTMVFDILSNTTNGINNDKLIEFFTILLDYGYRINNHIENEDFYEFCGFKNLKEKLIELSKMYPDNYESFICFDVSKFSEVLYRKKFINCGVYTKNIVFTETLNKEVVRLCNEFELFNEKIEHLLFSHIKNDLIYFYNIKLNKYVCFNENIINGNNLKIEDFKILDLV